jgi:hypothetical protein
METKESKKFVEFCTKCDQENKNPITIAKHKTMELMEKKFASLEKKYNLSTHAVSRTTKDEQNKSGKTWADLAGEVYDDVKDGIDEITTEIAEWWYS